MSEVSGKTIEISNDIGNIKFTDDVVASIAALAASEEEGMLSIADVNGVKNNSKGVRISIEDDKVYAELYITVRYGYSIPKITASVQDKVRNAIDVMTGLDVVSVDVHVSDIDIPQ